jgi:nitrate reductase alpha subunit
MSSDDSQTVSFLKGQLAKAEDELKKKQDANADATVVATYQADVVSLTNRIVSQLALEQEKKEAALKEEKEKKEAALMEEKEKMAAALKEAQENHRALLKEMTANAKGLSAAEKEIHYKYLLADSEGEVKKLQAVVDTLTNAVLGLGGTLHELIADLQSTSYAHAD